MAVSSRQSRLRHVAGTLRQLGIAQIPHGEPRPGLRRMKSITSSIFYSHRHDQGAPLGDPRWSTSSARARALVGLSLPLKGSARFAIPLPRRTRRSRACFSGPVQYLQPPAETSGRAVAFRRARFGAVAFFAAGAGLLTGRYLGGVPPRIRAWRRVVRCSARC